MAVLHGVSWRAARIAALGLACLLAGLAPCELWGQAPVITTVAGNGAVGYSGDNDPATTAKLNAPAGVAVDSAGNLYIADSANHRIRKVDPAGTITTVAGTGAAGFAGDNGPAASARLNNPSGVALDSAGNLYIADFNNHRVRRVDPSGIITTVAGNGSIGYAGDNGPAISARLNYPSGVAVDTKGNLYIADLYNQRVRKVDSNGIITTSAGNGTIAYAGDHGPATSAGLYLPRGVAVDDAGNLFIAEQVNLRIRKVDAATGLITTVAGSGMPGYGGDGGPAVKAQLYYPYGVAVDGAGDLYIADFYNQRIRKVDPSGIITTVAGNGMPGYAGDNGPATSARLYYPNGVAVDSTGSLYIADTNNFRVRKVTTNGAPATSFALSAPASVVAQSTFSFTVTALDRFGKPAAGYKGTVHFASSDSQALMPPDYTFSATDKGLHTFSAVLKTAGGQTITATDTVKAAVFGTSNSILVSDFALNTSAPISLSVGGSGSAPVSVNSLFGFNSPVALSVSGTPMGVTASFNISSVTPPAGGSANSVLSVGVSPAILPATFPLIVNGNSGGLTHSASITVTITARAPSVINVIDEMTAAGCIDNRGVANALSSKLTAAQSAIDSGNAQTAINILNALLQQISAQTGKHIAASCTAGGMAFSPAEVLTIDVQALIASLNVSHGGRGRLNSAVPGRRQVAAKAR